MTTKAVTPWFLAYLPRRLSDPADPNASTLREYADANGLRVRGDSWLLVLGDDNGERGGADADQSLQVLDTLPGIAASGLQQAWVGAPVDSHDWLEQKVQIFNLVTASRSGLTIISDPLGIKPYYICTLEEGTLVASSMRKLLAWAPHLVRPMDHLGVLQFLATGYAAGDRTLHSSIKRASAGARLMWTPGEAIRVDRSNRISLPPLQAGISAAEATGRLKEMLLHSIDSFLQPSAGDTLVPLTGGFDSRLLAGACQRSKRSIRTCTLGLPQHREVKLAAMVARNLGIPWRLITPKTDVLDLLPHWSQTLEVPEDLGSLFSCHLLAEMPAGSDMLNGFVGGVTSGGNLGLVSPDDLVSRDRMARALAIATKRQSAPNLGELAGLDATLEDHVADLETMIFETNPDYRSVVLWDLENRQRRYISTQLLYLGQHYRVGVPFYDRAQMEFWLSMPRFALDKQAMLLELFEAWLPEVATLPHSEQPPTRLPRRWDAALMLGSHYWEQFSTKIAARLGVKKETISRWRREKYQGIWTAWHGTSVEQKTRQLDALESTLGHIQDVLGWNVPPLGSQFWEAGAGNEYARSLLLRRLFVVGEYARELKPLLTQPTGADSSVDAAA